MGIWRREGRQGEHTELNFKGSGCDPEVLGVIEDKKPKIQPNFTQKCLFLRIFLPLASSKSVVTPKTNEIKLCGFLLTLVTHGYLRDEVLVEIPRLLSFFSYFMPKMLWGGISL